MSSDYGKENHGADQRPRYYEVLCISHDATPEQIKSAYRKRAHETHPDKNPGIDEKEFRLVGEAYRILSNDQERFIYDKSLRTGSQYAERPTVSPVYAEAYTPRESVSPRQRPEPKRDTSKEQREAKEVRDTKTQQNEQTRTEKLQKATAERDRLHRANEEKRDQDTLANKQARAKKVDELHIRLQRAKITKTNTYAEERDFSVGMHGAEREFSVRAHGIERAFSVQQYQINREYSVLVHAIDRIYNITKHQIDKEYARTVYAFSH